MKKIILISCILVLAMTGNSFAACEGGSTVTGLTNGHEYCASNSKMNWWSAYTWCKAQGMKMPSLYDLCPTWDGAFNSDQCEKIGVGALVWASAAYGNSSAILLADVNAVGHVTGYSRTKSFRAVCISK